MHADTLNDPTTSEPLPNIRVHLRYRLLNLRLESFFLRNFNPLRHALRTIEPVRRHRGADACNPSAVRARLAAPPCMRQRP
jgi:hypothetical protein